MFWLATLMTATYDAIFLQTVTAVSSIHRGGLG
jgi:hypothetical protein